MYRHDVPKTPEERMEKHEYMEADTNRDIRMRKWSLVEKAVQGIFHGFTSLCVGAAVSGVIYAISLFWK